LCDLAKEALFTAVGEVAPEARVAIAFSGGLDSTLLAKICTDLGKQVTLITVGFSGSHDLEFSKQIASMIGLPQLTTTIGSSDFAETLLQVKQLVHCSNTSHIENCIAYRYISATAKKYGLDLVLSANGFDELFCGYNG
jgi:asparagine synthase (glutamine-hydrolysing)